MSFLRNRLSVLVMISCLSLLGTIGWQSVYGHRNFEFRQKLAAHEAAAQAALDKVTADRNALETRVVMLRPGSIDADLLDEIARHDLNMGKKTDIIAHVIN